MVVGTYIPALPFGLSLFSRTQDAQKLNEFYRPLMSEQGIAHFGTNLGIVDNGGSELFRVMIPRLEHDLDMTGPQFGPG